MPLVGRMGSVTEQGEQLRISWHVAAQHNKFSDEMSFPYSKMDVLFNEH